MSRRTVLTAWFIAGVAGALIWAIVEALLTFPSLDVIPSLAVRFVLLSWMGPFFVYLTPSLGTAALLAFGLFLQTDGGPGTRLITLSRPFLIGTLVVTTALAAWHAALGPLVEHRLDEITFQSDLAVQSWEDARNSIALGRYLEAEEKIEVYEFITKDQDGAEQLREELVVERGQEEQERRERERAEPESEPRQNDITGLTVPDLIFRAAEFYQDQEYFSAHYYATRALELADTDRQDARRIQQQAWSAIQSEGQQLQDQQARDLYEAKLEAYQAMQQGETIPERLVEAYYRFQRLEERAPEDPDVERYSSVVEQRLEDVAVFSDELQQYAATPGVQKILFDNADEPGETEIVAIDRLVQVRQGTYTYGVEVMNIVDGQVRFHFRVPYGKLVGDTLILRSIRRDGTGISPADNSTVPFYMVGDRESPESAMLRMTESMELISLVGAGEAWYRWAHVGNLLRAPQVQRRMGLSATSAYAAVTDRLARLLVFPVSTLVLMTLAWRYRSRYHDRPPALALLLVPAFPFMVLFVDRLFRYTVRLAGTVALTAMPVGLGYAVAILVAVILLGVSVWYHAAQTIRS